MNSVIEEYYEKYNYISNVDKLYKLIKDDNIKVSKNDIKLFLDSQEEQQLTKQTKSNKKQSGHIVACINKKSFQIDIFDLNKYSAYNKGYKYIFTMIDLFSRFVYCVPMITKSEKDCVNALKSILSKNNLISFLDTFILSSFISLYNLSTYNYTFHNILL